MEFPRPYEIVIYFTSTNCRLCSDVFNEFKKVAKFYLESGAMEREGKKRPVFFATMQFNDLNRQVFNQDNNQQLGFSSVPNLFVSQPRVVVVPQDERERYLREFKWLITPTDGHVTSHKLLEYVNKRTGRSVEYKPSPSEALMMVGILVGTISVVVLLFRGAKPIFNNTKLWFAGSMAIYVVCMAGLVYNIIHNVPFTTMDQKGNIEWKSKGGRQQLGAEGFIMSACISLVGITIILYHKLVGIAQVKNLDGTVLRLSYLILFGITWVVIRFIEDVYKEKSWYDPKFWPPAHYIRGPIMRDQGNTI